jgi:hypothetical protein
MRIAAHGHNHHADDILFRERGVSNPVWEFARALTVMTKFPSSNTEREMQGKSGLYRRQVQTDRTPTGGSTAGLPDILEQRLDEMTQVCGQLSKAGYAWGSPEANPYQACA